MKLKETENIAKELHYARNKFNVNLPSSIQEAKDNNWTQPELFWSEYVGAFYHQDWNLFNWVELKFVSPDGHKEVIFCSDGVIQNSPGIMGTYNYFAPSDRWNHKKYDMDPYLLWGNVSN